MPFQKLVRSHPGMSENAVIQATHIVRGLNVIALERDFKDIPIDLDMAVEKNHGKIIIELFCSAESEHLTL